MTYTEKLATLANGNDTIDTLKGAILEGGGGTAPDLSDYAKIEDLNTADTFKAMNVTLDTPAPEALDKVLLDMNALIGTGGTDLSSYYTILEIDDTFITKVNGNNAIADLAPKTGLYQTSGGAPIDLETQCQSLETRVADSVTDAELVTALNTSTTFMVLDPSTSAQGTLDAALANIYVAPVRMSEQDMTTMTTKVAKEIVNNPDYLRLIVKSVTDVITKST